MSCCKKNKTFFLMYCGNYKVKALIWNQIPYRGEIIQDPRTQPTQCSESAFQRRPSMRMMTMSFQQKLTISALKSSLPTFSPQIDSLPSIALPVRALL